MFLLVLLAWIPFLAAGGAIFHLALRFVRAAERRSATTAELAEVRERLLRVEEAMADMSTDIRRIAEGQQFTARVLEARHRESAPAPRAPQTPETPGPGAAD
jgi:hypothetical protein